MIFSQSAQTTERHSLYIEIAAEIVAGGYAEIPCEAGPHPTVAAAGRVDYGRPWSRVTWQRALPAPRRPAGAYLPPYRHQSASVRG